MLLFTRILIRGTLSSRSRKTVIASFLFLVDIYLDFFKVFFCLLLFLCVLDCIL